MEALLDELCALLGDELERQEILLSLSQAQQAAIVSRDVAEVESRTGAIQLLVREVVQSESRRAVVSTALARELNLPPNACLTQLALLSPEPWQGRLRFLQSRLRGVMDASRQLNRENAFLLRRSLRMVDQCLRFIQPASTGGSGSYTPTGHEPSTGRQAAAFVNQRG